MSEKKTEKIKNKPLHKRISFWILIISLVTIFLSLLLGGGSKEDNNLATSAKDATPTIMALSESNIEKLSNIDGVKIELGDIKVIRLGQRQDKNTKDVYKNVYYANGDYRYEGHIYKYNMTFNFDRKNILDDKMKYQVIQYGNSATKVGIFEPDLTANIKQ